MSDPGKRKHMNLEIAQKIKALKDVKSGISVKQVAQGLGVSPRTIQRWERNKEKLLQCEQKFDGNVPAKMRRMTTPQNQKVDLATWIWYKERKAAGLPIAGGAIRAQARWFWMNLGGNQGFDASPGWLIKWKLRHGISSTSPSKSQKASNSTDSTHPGDLFDLDPMDFTDQTEQTDSNHSNNSMDSIESSEMPSATSLERGREDDPNSNSEMKMVQEKLEKIISEERLSPHQIFSCDCLNFNYKQLPKNILGQFAQSGNKVVWERLTVMACSNSSGNFKLPLTVIGRSEDPKALRDLETVPVSYRSHKTSSLTSEMLGQWFKEEFEPLVKFYLLQKELPMRALLVVGEYEKQFSGGNFQSDFVRIKVINDAQPLGHGCLQELKMRYRRKLMRHVVEHFNTGAVLLEAVENVTWKNVIFWLRDAWRETTTSTIIKGWEKLWPGVTKYPGLIGDVSKYTNFCDNGEQKFHEVYFNEVDLVKDQLLLALQKVNEEIEIADVDYWLNTGLQLAEYECLTDSDIIRLVNMPDSDDEEKREPPDLVLPEALSNLESIIRHCEKKKYYKSEHVTVLRELHEAMKVEERQQIELFHQCPTLKIKRRECPDLIQRYIAAFGTS